MSSIGSTWMRFPYFTSGHGWTETTSDNRTLKLFLTMRFMRIFSSGQVSSDNTIQTVSFLRFPFRSTVSPLNNCNSSIFACDNATTELSSLTASSTINLLGRSLRRKIAVARSSGLKCWKKRSNYIQREITCSTTSLLTHPPWWQVYCKRMSKTGKPWEAHKTRNPTLTSFLQPLQIGFLTAEFKG